ncbi:hypothetical protein PCL_10505 [Purpureocillium lilacinum]|uniref:HEAT repeat domain-containing protein n=1 Tax=Purpureocillium lilacinum TaxID=33203 RepID=A0A2U3DQ62_PURLI|nr:hypothetical protein PCL_10505 [Purpureocillium lilacinum]
MALETCRPGRHADSYPNWIAPGRIGFAGNPDLAATSTADVGGQGGWCWHQTIDGDLATVTNTNSKAFATPTRFLFPRECYLVTCCGTASSSLYKPRPHLLNRTQQLSSKPDEKQKPSLPIQDLHLRNLPQTRSVKRPPGLLTSIRAGTILTVVIAADLVQFTNNFRHASMDIGGLDCRTIIWPDSQDISITVHCKWNAGSYVHGSLVQAEYEVSGRDKVKFDTSDLKGKIFPPDTGGWTSLNSSVTKKRMRDGRLDRPVDPVTLVQQGRYGCDPAARRQDPGVRRVAIWALEKHSKSSDEFLKAIAQRLKDRASAVRVTALMILEERPSLSQDIFAVPMVASGQAGHAASTRRVPPPEIAGSDGLP